jgi:hypothetical protein
MRRKDVLDGGREHTLTPLKSRTVIEYRVNMGDCLNADSIWEKPPVRLSRESVAFVVRWLWWTRLMTTRGHASCTHYHDQGF